MRLVLQLTRQHFEGKVCENKVYKTFLSCSEVAVLHWISGCFFFYLIISIATTSVDHNRKTL
jgi:hypothetical protein